MNENIKYEKSSIFANIEQEKEFERIIKEKSSLKENELLKEPILKTVGTYELKFFQGRTSILFNIYCIYNKEFMLDTISLDTNDIERAKERGLTILHSIIYKEINDILIRKGKLSELLDNFSNLII